MGKARKKRARRYVEKSSVMNFRCQPITRRLLEAAVKRSGRTISAECEYQLHRALSDMSTGPTYAILSVIGRAIDSLVRLRPDPAAVLDSTGMAYAVLPHNEKDSTAKWTDDPYLYSQAQQALLAGLEMFRPPGAPPQDLKDLLDLGGTRQGRFAVETTLRELQLISSKPFAKRTPYERWLTTIKEGLGELVDRPVVWGQTAEQARKEYDRITLEERRELVQLHRKGHSRTAAESERLDELEQKMLGEEK
jgi:hypothetical protein